jgi:hypothetical protein
MPTAVGRAGDEPQQTDMPHGAGVNGRGGIVGDALHSEGATRGGRGCKKKRERSNRSGHEASF